MVGHLEVGHGPGRAGVPHGDGRLARPLAAVAGALRRPAVTRLWVRVRAAGILTLSKGQPLVVELGAGGARALAPPDDVEHLSDRGPALVRWRATLSSPHLTVDVVLGSYRADADSQDGVLIREHDDGVLLAVADGVTPTVRTPTIDGMDGARYAALLVLHHIGGAPTSLAARFHAANTALLRTPTPEDNSRLGERDRPQAAAIAADISLPTTGRPFRMDVVRAADCDAWVRRGDRWTLITPTRMLTAEARAALDRWDARNPAATVHERVDFENAVVAERSCWNLTALGRFADPLIEQRHTSVEFDELLLATDGAGLTPDIDLGQIDLDDWFTGLRHREQESRPPHRAHSDVAVLHAKRHDID